jgi:hypothetical protein
MRGRLEREIRLLPQVLSCSFTQDDVVVLADLSADGPAIRAAVERILESAGESIPVRVIGPSLHEPIPSRALSPMLVTASVAGVAVLGVGALVGGLVAIDHPKVERPKRPETVQAGGAPLTSNRDWHAGFSFGEKAPPGAPPTPGQPVRVLPPTAGIAAEAVSLPRALSHKHLSNPTEPTGPINPTEPTGPIEQSLSCDHPPLRGAPRLMRGRHLGNGPMPWSRSVLVPPHSCDERGRSS